VNKIYLSYESLSTFDYWLNVTILKAMQRGRKKKNESRITSAAVGDLLMPSSVWDVCNSSYMFL
jgi:hypothetical protein